MRLNLMVAVTLSLCVWEMGISAKATEIKGKGGDYYAVFNSDATAYHAVATPENDYVFIKPKAGTGWAPVTLDKNKAEAEKTNTDPLKSPGFFGNAVYGKIAKPGPGPGTPPKWALIGDRINLHCGDEYARKIVPWKGSATFAASGGDTGTIEWKLTKSSTVMTGTGGPFKIEKSDFGDDGKIKEPGEYTLSAEDEHGAGDSLSVVLLKINIAFHTSSMTHPKSIQHPIYQRIGVLQNDIITFDAMFDPKIILPKEDINWSGEKKGDGPFVVVKFKRLGVSRNEKLKVFSYQETVYATVIRVPPPNQNTWAT